MSKTWHRTNFKLDDYHSLQQSHDNAMFDAVLEFSTKEITANAVRLDLIVDRIKELQIQIEKLQLDVEANTAYAANLFLKNNYPRFSDYSEFIRNNYYTYDKSDLSCRFSVLMRRFINNELTTKDEINMAEVRLSDFIWLFFLGAGAFTADYVIDFDKVESTTGNIDYMPYCDYTFSVLVPSTKKAYQVVFRFFDVEWGLDINNRKLYVPYENVEDSTSMREHCAIRNCNYGKINAYVQKKLTGFDNMLVKQNPSDYADNRLSSHCLSISSFNPIEIAAWLDSLFNSKSKSKELELLEESNANGSK